MNSTIDGTTNSTTTVPSTTTDSSGIPRQTAFSIMFVTIGLSCFLWQTFRSGYIFYKGRKPIAGLVFAQAVLGVIVTFVTLLTSLVDVDCNFRLLFSVVGVNLADISLLIVLLWKAYLGHNRSKIILVIGTFPIMAIFAFIVVNLTVGRSNTYSQAGVCAIDYPTYVVIAKAAIDCASNTWLSGCFLIVIYRHYQILGSTVQKALLTDGLLYCIGVCLSNIITGILLAKDVLGGNTPIIYTVDWYLASYLIIKQLKINDPPSKLHDDEEDNHNDIDNMSIESHRMDRRRKDDRQERDFKYISKDRDTYYNSLDGTLVPSSPRIHHYIEEEKYNPTTISSPFEQRIYVSTPIIDREATLAFENSSSSQLYTSSFAGTMDETDEKIISAYKRLQHKPLSANSSSGLIDSASNSINQVLEKKY